MKKSNLYLILDAQVNSYEELFEIAKKALSAGVDIIQLRDKQNSVNRIMGFCQKLLDLSEKHNAVFIVNDRVDIALAVKAHGVHLGQDDFPLKEARSLLGKNIFIGISCQNLQQAKKAQADGADYIGFGSVFKTKTKPYRDPMDLKLLKKVLAELQIPVFPIGGINLSNVKSLVDIGVYRLAVCRSVCQAREVQKVVQEMKRDLKNKV